MGTYVRQAEIEAWLREADRPWEEWLAVDDQPWLFRPFLPNLVRCDPATGLTEEVCTVLKNKLQRTDKVRLLTRERIIVPEYPERRELAKQFASDVARMRNCLQAAGKEVDEDDIVCAWTDYSDGLCAVWLMLPDKDDALLAILLKHLPPSRLVWQLTVEDAGDSSGAAMLSLPEELLTQAGWKLGDKLSVAIAEPGALILQRME